MGDTRILVVDDDPTTRDVLSRMLTQAGYEVVDTFSAEEALAWLHRETFALVMLDVVMPHVDGFECCRRIREFSDIPVIFVTARNDSHNEVEGFQAGGDDYITKPFFLAAVLSRVRAVLRRVEEPARREVSASGGGTTVGPLRLDTGAQEAYVDGRPANLTIKEFELLRLLVERCGEIVSREDLSQEVWGHEFDPDSKTLRVHIYRLRKKLDQIGGLGRFVITKRERGYLLSPGIRDAA